MIIKTDKLICLSIVLILITSYFSVIIGINAYILAAISFIPISSYLLSLKLYIDKEILLWLFFFIISLISSLQTIMLKSTWQFMALLLLSLLIKIVLHHTINWMRCLYITTYIFSAVIVVTTVLFLIIPDIMLTFVSMIYTGEILQAYMRLYNGGAYAGISAQTSINAFIASIFLGCAICNLLCDKGKRINILFCLLAITTVLMSAKRSMLVANLTCIFVMLFLIKKSSIKKYIITLTSSLIVGSLGCILIFKFIPAANAIFEKTSRVATTGDISHGRFDLWSDTWEVFIDNVLFGCGAGSLEEIYGISSHNVYLQVLCETGLMGLLSYIIAVLYSLVSTYTLINKLNQDNKKEREIVIYLYISLYIQILYLIYSAFGNPMYSMNFLFPYILWTCICASVKKNIKSDENYIKKGDYDAVFNSYHIY